MKKYEFAVARIIFSSVEHPDFGDEMLLSTGFTEKSYADRQVYERLKIKSDELPDTYSSKVSIYLQFLNNCLGWEIISAEEEISSKTRVWRVYLRKR